MKLKNKLRLRKALRDGMSDDEAITTALLMGVTFRTYPGRGGDLHYVEEEGTPARLLRRPIQRTKGDAARAYLLSISAY